MLWYFAYLVTVFLSFFAFYSRAGLADLKQSEGIDWREFLLPNLGWFMMTFGKQLVWPAVLVAWLATGRLPSKWRAVSSVGGRPARKIVPVEGA